MDCFYFGKEVSSITKKLTLKQQRFVDEYIISGNATQAAIKAGYSKKTANRIATENLSKPVIKTAIDKRNAEIQSEKTMDMQEVMELLASIARGETTEETVTNKGDVIETATRNSDKLKALELIGKRFGAWTDKKEISGNLDIEIGMGDYDDED
ncbi:terminase small subunit [Limosilactobacillus fermentum]|uniref:terminase small subunit n=2 Tax=Limosilactobacillus fermentum TaxID=1613 RepID=UPI0005FC2330|nr:terminase small subunit [Limosilactobacillus fermentum]MCT3443806.1 terminase small subunit [Limosilactobacillus fermentum]PJF06075.1 terminase small subunit [Limosilactobacillus fermentum]